MSEPINKPVLFKRPENWATMSDEEQDAFADHILTLMGMPEDEGSK
jgi:hypothetical protein